MFFPTACRWVSPAPRAVLPAIAIIWLAGLPHSASAVQASSVECSVVGTFLGRWNQVELRCTAADSTHPKAAIVIPERLRTCPLLRGDRVAVSFEDNNPARAANITAARSRGAGGPSSGDWCGVSYPPGRYTGPCVVEEQPPPAERADTAGATWTRRSVVTWFRDTDDNRRSVSGACRPVDLEPGVYRIYIKEDTSHGQRVPGPTYYADRRTVDRVEWETNTYEGGISVAGASSPTDSVTDVAPLVRGWPGVAQGVATTPPVTPAGTFQPIALTTDPLAMTGVRFLARTIVTDPLAMTGVRFLARTIVTEPLAMTGVRFLARTIATDPLSMTGVRFIPLRIRTAPLSMTGRRFDPVSIRTIPLTLTGIRR